MIIAHEYPILLVDKVLEIRKLIDVKAIKNISFNEKVFKGHFPKQPVYPAIYIVEGLCQCAQLIANFELAVTAKLDKFKFSKPVFPGDQLQYHVSLDSQVGRFIVFKAKATVNGKKVATGVITGCQLEKAN